MSACAIPAFDAGHPDAEILEAFEKVRAMRAHSYSFDDIPGDRPYTREEDDAYDAEMQEHELGVLDNWATTPTGVAVRLALALPVINQERWVDRGLMSQGISAVYHARKSLDGHGQQIIQAAFELLHIEFEQAFAIYKRSSAQLTNALKLKSIVEAECFRVAREGEKPSDWLTGLAEISEVIEEGTCDSEDLAVLVSTLAPDWECYRRKAQIAISEGFASEAAPWLVRDVNFLTGKIVLDPPAAAEAA